MHQEHQLEIYSNKATKRKSNRLMKENMSIPDLQDSPEIMNRKVEHIIRIDSRMSSHTPVQPSKMLEQYYDDKQRVNIQKRNINSREEVQPYEIGHQSNQTDLNINNSSDFDMGQCNQCGRSFFLSRLQKHQQYCASLNKPHANRFGASNQAKSVSKQSNYNMQLLNKQSSIPEIKKREHQTECENNQLANESLHHTSRKTANYFNNKQKSKVLTFSSLNPDPAASIADLNASAITTKNDMTKLPKWKKDHLFFIQSIRGSSALETSTAGGSSDLIPVQVEDDYVQCPHCSRKYSEKVAERHINACKNIINKPKPPPSLSMSQYNNSGHYFTSKQRNEASPIGGVNSVVRTSIKANLGGQQPMKSDHQSKIRISYSKTKLLKVNDATNNNESVINLINNTSACSNGSQVFGQSPGQRPPKMPVTQKTLLSKVIQQQQTQKLKHNQSYQSIYDNNQTQSLGNSAHYLKNQSTMPDIQQRKYSDNNLSNNEDFEDYQSGKTTSLLHKSYINAKQIKCPSCQQIFSVQEGNKHINQCKKSSFFNKNEQSLNEKRSQSIMKQRQMQERIQEIQIQQQEKKNKIKIFKALGNRVDRSSDDRQPFLGVRNEQHVQSTQIDSDAIHNQSLYDYSESAMQVKKMNIRKEQFCTKCGVGFKKYDKFCGECGGKRKLLMSNKKSEMQTNRSNQSIMIRNDSKKRMLMMPNN